MNHGAATPAVDALDLGALAQRMGVVAGVLGLPGHADTDPAVTVSRLLGEVGPAVAGTDDDSLLWLWLTALAGAVPLIEEVDDVRHLLSRATVDEVTVVLLERLRVPEARCRPSARMRLVTDRPALDVDFSARNNLQTGIQRVTREVARHWVAAEEAELLAWTEGFGAYRNLQRIEELRATGETPLGAPSGLPAADHEDIVVPWDTVLILPEVAFPEQAGPLRSLVRHARNRVVMIGHDFIPLVSADLLPGDEIRKFASYLPLVAEADLVATNSKSTAEEFEGYRAMLATRGIRGPEVVACPLPIALPGATPPAPPRPPGPGATADGPPVVLAVGSHDPRKNHAAILHAAEVLWREGHRFRLRVIGGRGWTSQAFDAEVARLRAMQRPLVEEQGVSDSELLEAYRQARFTVFPSLQEGYGLPVAESMMCGTPAITTSYGSTAGIIAGGGALGVDPRDDASLIDAMRRLLTDDELLGRLTEECGLMADRTWRDYTDELRTLARGVLR